MQVASGLLDQQRLELLVVAAVAELQHDGLRRQLVWQVLQHVALEPADHHATSKDRVHLGEVRRAGVVALLVPWIHAAVVDAKALRAAEVLQRVEHLKLADEVAVRAERRRAAGQQHQTILRDVPCQAVAELRALRALVLDEVRLVDD